MWIERSKIYTLTVTGPVSSGRLPTLVKLSRSRLNWWYKQTVSSVTPPLHWECSDVPSFLSVSFDSEPQQTLTTTFESRRKRNHLFFQLLLKVVWIVSDHTRDGQQKRRLQVVDELITRWELAACLSQPGLVKRSKTFVKRTSCKMGENNRFQGVMWWSYLRDCVRERGFWW